jgi:integrase/recombinase XerC
MYGRSSTLFLLRRIRGAEEGLEMVYVCDFRIGHAWGDGSVVEARKRSTGRTPKRSVDVGSRRNLGIGRGRDRRGPYVAAAPSPRWLAELEPEPPTPVLKPRTTIVEAGQAFLTNRETKQVAPATLRKYVTFIKQLRAFADTRGYLMIDQFTTSDIDLFYARLKMGARAKGKRLGTLRAFFRFCVNRKWIDETPVSVDLKPPIGSSKAADKMPLSDDEIARIIAACDKPPCPPRGRNSSPVATGTFVGAVWKNDQGNGAWTGEDLKDIIWLMIYTGYRISDAVFFDMNRLRGNQVMIRAQKNGKQVFGVLPDWIRDRLLARAKVHGQRPFIVGRSRRLESLTNVWRRRIARAFAAAGEFEQTPTPHRFRHTFARILLEKGVSVADVAELMGDDEETVRISYSAWVPERQNRLTAILRDAFSERPKLVGIRGGLAATATQRAG